MKTLEQNKKKKNSPGAIHLMKLLTPKRRREGIGKEERNVRGL
jgi:hypothetical protein